MAVVCPGRGTALPATGRKWHRTSLSRARRNLVRPARPDQGGARASGRVLTATTARPRGGRSGNPGRAIISLGLRVPGEAPCSGSGENDKRYRRHHPASQEEPGLPVLILTIPNNPILQSCAQPDYNCGATLARTRMCVHVCHLTKPAARHIGGLRCSLYSRTVALPGHHYFRLLRFCEIPFFSSSNSHFCGVDEGAPV